MTRRLALSVALSLSGCILATGGKVVRKVGPPQTDRCAQQPEIARKSCEREREEALSFARKLAVDDQVCIDGEHRIERPMGGLCTVRAFVESTAPDGVKLEIREAPPDSRYEVQSDWWFAEEALADIQLQVLGYKGEAGAAR